MNSTMRIRTASTAVAFLAALATGCGSSGTDTDEPTSHPTQDTSISAKVGERFTLTVEENASTRERWSLADPAPDTSVVRSRGHKSASDSGDEQPVPGAGSKLTFTFEATGKGSTEIVLLHCTFAAPCDGGSGGPATPTPSPSPTATPSASASATPSEPERVTYTVTVS